MATPISAEEKEKLLQQPVTLAMCEAKYSNVKLGIMLIMGVLGVCGILIGLSVKQSWSMYEQSVELHKVLTAQNERTEQRMDVHEAKQNGSLDKIGFQLDTISNVQQQVLVDMKEQRVLFEELLRKSHLANPE